MVLVDALRKLFAHFRPRVTIVCRVTVRTYETIVWKILPRRGIPCHGDRTERSPPVASRVAQGAREGVLRVQYRGAPVVICEYPAALLILNHFSNIRPRRR